MKLNVNPTRMELLRLKKRLVMARRGHKLLKDKQDELMRRFLAFIRDIRDLRQEVEKGLTDAFSRFLFVSATLNPQDLEEALSVPGKKLQVDVQSETIMNLRAPVFTPSVEGEVICYGYGNTSGELDISLFSVEKVLKKLILLAQKEKWMDLLADEIVKTRRRVNALEYVLIPNIEETIRSIEMKLSEMERSNFSRLMKVKEIVEAH